jgi:glycosyltransferase involved in cell wall biosynthesis
MDQVAGHVTTYLNLRSVAEHDPEIKASWHEIVYYTPGGSIERFREKLVPFVPTYPTGIMRGSLETYRALRHQRYDAIFNNAAVGVFFSSTFRRTPTLTEIDSTPRQIDRMPAYQSGRPDPKPLEWFKWRLFRNMLHASALVKAHSNWARQSAIDEYGVAPEKVVVVPPGVDLDLWQPPTWRTAAKPARILFVGGDFRRKGGRELLQWYKSQSPADYELHIATREPVENGPGVYVYRDLQPNSPALLRLYHQSDLFVLPSLGECFGVATIEAMAAGLPVIASDVGGTADIIEPGRNGFIIPAGQVAALGQAIVTVLEDEDRRQAMARQSRLLAEERFDLQKNARRSLQYLKQIARAEADCHQPSAISQPSEADS